MMTRHTYTSAQTNPLVMTLFDENKRVINMVETGNITYPLESNYYSVNFYEWVVLANLEPGVWTSKEIAVGGRLYKAFNELTPKSFSDRYVLVTSRNGTYAEPSNTLYSRLGVCAPTTIAYNSFGLGDLRTKLRYYTPRNYGVNSLIYRRPPNLNQPYVEYMIVCPEAKYMMLDSNNAIDASNPQTVDVSDFYDSPRNRYKDVGDAAPEEPNWVVTGQYMESRKYYASDIKTMGKKFAMLFEIRDRHLIPLDETVPDFLSGVEYPESAP